MLTALVCGVQVDSELSDTIILRLFDDEIRNDIVKYGISFEEAFGGFKEELGDFGEEPIPGTSYKYTVLKDRDWKVIGIFIGLMLEIASPNKPEAHQEPTPLEISTFLEFLGLHGIGVGGQGELPVSEYALWTVPVN